MKQDKEKEQDYRKKEQQNGTSNKSMQQNQSKREKMGPSGNKYKNARTIGEGKKQYDDAYDPELKGERQ